MAEKIGDYMATDGTKFLKKCVPTKVSVLLIIMGVAFTCCVGVVFQIELLSEGPPRVLRVHYKNTETGEANTEDFNTVSHMTVIT